MEENNTSLEKLEFKDIVELYLKGDKAGVSSLADQSSLSVKYMSVDIGTGTTTTESKIVSLSGLEVGLENKSDNMSTEDATSGANVTLSEAETLAYPLVTYINKLIDVISSQTKIIEKQNTTIKELDTRVTTLESKSSPTPTPTPGPTSTN